MRLSACMILRSPSMTLSLTSCSVEGEEPPAGGLSLDVLSVCCLGICIVAASGVLGKTIRAVNLESWARSRGSPIAERRVMASLRHLYVEGVTSTWLVRVLFLANRSRDATREIAGGLGEGGTSHCSHCCSELVQAVSAKKLLPPLETIPEVPH